MVVVEVVGVGGLIPPTNFFYNWPMAAGTNRILLDLWTST